MLAATCARPAGCQGALLLVGYTLGLGIPFILIAAFYDRSQRMLRFLVRHGRAVSLVGGLLVAAIGVAMMFDWLILLPRYFQFVVVRMTDADRVGRSRAEPAAAPPRRAHRPVQRAPAARARWAWSCWRGRAARRRHPAHRPRARAVRRPPLPGATPFLVGAPIEGLQPGNLAPELEWSTHDGATASSSRTSTATRSGSRTCEGKLVWLNFWASLVPAVPGRDAGPARPRRAVRRPGPRDRRRRGPGDDRRQRPGLRRALPAGLHDRVRRLGRHLRLYKVFALPTQVFVGPDGDGPAGRQRPAEPPGRAGADRRLAAEGLTTPQSLERLQPLEPEAVAVRDQRPTGIRRSWLSDHDPVVLDRAPEQLALDLDRVEREVVERRHPARVRGPRPHRTGRRRTPRDRAPGPVPRTTIAWWPAEWPPVRTTDTPGSSSRSPSAQPSAPQSATSRSSGWSYEATSREFVAERDLPLLALGDDPRPRERPRPVRVEQPAGVVVVEVAHRDDVDGAGVEARGAQRRHDRRALRTRASRRSSRPAAPRSRSRSSTRPAGVSTSRQLSAWSSRRCSSSSPSATVAPQDPRHRPQDRAGVRPERPGLDERDPVVPPPRSSRQWTASLMATASARRVATAGRDASAWIADAVGSTLALVLGAELLGAVRPLHRASSSGRS